MQWVRQLQKKQNAKNWFNVCLVLPNDLHPKKIVFVTFDLKIHELRMRKTIYEMHGVLHNNCKPASAVATCYFVKGEHNSLISGSISVTWKGLHYSGWVYCSFSCSLVITYPNWEIKRRTWSAYNKPLMHSMTALFVSF